MAKGDLDARISTRFMTGFYGKCANNLNALADVAIAAARKQLQSERMRTELITNISHDIKTPLTSIINYVDLMQRVESPEEAQAYLEVLGRQSQRLKKLIEDLVEMSKASTGNMHVELAELNLTETVNQALGEFYEKLEKAGITPMFTPQEVPPVIADGRLVWRVLSNLLSNAVKYAMPGTRLYIDVAVRETQLQLSLKNVSREPLTLTPEELTERFVRGDTSRNTEGSGLGLNIARSLMELQKGQLQLQIDGDLFKATLVFSRVPEQLW
jgi:signal transduction histidine kinase